MPVMDEFREERAAIKNGTFKQKYQYFKDYYRTPLIITVIAAIFIGAFLYNFLTAKDIAFYAVLLNSSPSEENEWFLEEYAQTAGIDLDEYDIMLDSSSYYKLNSYDEVSYTTQQKLYTYVGAGQLDVMLSTGDEFMYFANNLLFMDLRNVLSEEQIKKYEPYFYYIDASLADGADVNATEPQPFDVTKVPDPRKPEEMGRPIPVAVYVESSNKLNEAYYFQNSEDGIALGIYSNTSQPERAVSLIEFLLEN